MPIPTDSIKISQLTAASSSSTTDEFPLNQGGVTKKTNPALISTDYKSLAVLPSTVTYLSQRSYELTFPSVDYSDVLSPGMRIRTTRTVAAPTQSTSLNGTNQYWVKTSPNKMTFTDDFAVGVWVKPTSYQLGTIVSRYNGTNGWELLMLADGRVLMRGFNGGSANLRGLESVQSLPLNKWTFIAAQNDMSAFTTTPTTSYIMFDGVDVPATLSQSGTNPTSLVQDGNLEIGSRNGGTWLFPGKIAQVAIFNAKVTQATMRGYISQSLSGTEPNLVSAYSFDNNSNDLNTTTPNNLTAMNAAGYANESPFGTQADDSVSSTIDYGIIMSVVGGINTSVTVQVPDGCTIPTTGGISSVGFATVDSPHGFPKDAGRWRISYVGRVQASKTSGISLGIFYSLGIGAGITVPAGSWGVSYRVYAQHTATSTQYLTHSVVLTTSTDGTALASLAGVGRLPASALISSAGSNGANVGQWDHPHVMPTKFIKLSSATAVNLLVSANSGSSPSLYINGLSPNGDLSIDFDNALL